MASAKTLRLLSTAYNIEENGMQILVLKPSIDDRDGIDVVKSRAGLERKCVSVSDDVDLFKAINEYSHVLSETSLGRDTLRWVFVDECQFLTEKQVDELSDVVDILDVNVACFGLRTDFKTKLFDGSKRLFEIADTIEEIKATCSCGDGKSCVNARVDDDGNIVKDGDQILIGGSDSYRSICRRCWKKLT